MVALHFRVTGMADKHTLATITAVFDDLHVYLGHQWAGGIKDFQIAPIRFLTHCLGNAVGAEYYNNIVRHFVEFIHKHHTPLPQVVHHVFVVHHFMAHIDGGAKLIQGALDNIDGAIHSGAEATGIGQLYSSGSGHGVVTERI